MCKVRYYDTILPTAYEVEFDSEKEALVWIETEMQEWHWMLCEEYPTYDVTWINRLMDYGDTTEIYVPDTNILISCTLIH